MKSIAMIFLSLLGIYSCQQDEFAELHQLCGTWMLKTNRGNMYESWKKASDTELQGKSYKINGTDTIVFETTRLSKSTDGIYYIPIVADQNQGKEVSFKMIKSDNRTFVFENKAHDFPQRIIYHLVTKDSVHAWIEGTENGKEGRSDYYFKRMH